MITRACVTVALLAAVAGVGPASAGADGTTPLKAFTSHATYFQESQGQRDGSCPRSTDGPGRPVEDAHQLFSARFDRPADGAEETLGVDVCWFNSSAMASGPVDRGRFELIVPYGSFSGSVTGGWGDAPAVPLNQFTLTITKATGVAKGWVGSHFVFFACDYFPKMAGLRLRGVNPNFRCPIPG